MGHVSPPARHVPAGRCSNVIRRAAKAPTGAGLKPCKWEQGQHATAAGGDGCWPHRSGKCRDVHADQPELLAKLKGQTTATNLTVAAAGGKPAGKQKPRIDMRGADRMIFHNLPSGDARKAMREKIRTKPKPTPTPGAQSASRPGAMTSISIRPTFLRSLPPTPSPPSLPHRVVSLRPTSR